MDAVRRCWRNKTMVFFFLCLVFGTAIPTEDLVECVPLPGSDNKTCSSCVLRLTDSGKVIDFRKGKDTRFIVKDRENESYSFVWSPCEDFDMFIDEDQVNRSCKNTALGRFNNKSKTCYSLGSHASSWFSVIPQKPDPVVVIHFRSSTTSEFEDTQVKLICDREGNEDRLSYKKIKPKQLEFSFYSRCACGNGCLKGFDSNHEESLKNLSPLNPEDKPIPESTISCSFIPGLPDNERYCVCRLSDTKNLIDLRPLARSGHKPKFVTDGHYQGWEYGWSPCKNFNMYTQEGSVGCNNTALARYTKDSSQECQNLGNHELSWFTASRDNNSVAKVFIHYQDSRFHNTRDKAYVKLVCSPTTKMNKFTFKGEHDTKGARILVFTLKSNEACERTITPTASYAPSHATHKPIPSSYWIGGSVGVIALFVMMPLIVYLVIRWKRQRRPRRQGPREHDENQPLLGH